MQFQLQPPPAMPRIRCAICDRRVARVILQWNPGRQETIIVAECHGDRDTMVLTQRDLMCLTREQLRELEDQEGVAFLTKRLPPSS